MITGFVAQFGLSGNPALQARYCNDETCPPAAARDGAALPPDAVRMSNTRGTVALSLMQGGVNGSVELFVNLGNNSRLDALGFAPFGVVQGRGGMDAVDALYAGYGELNESSICTKPHELCNGPKLQRILIRWAVKLLKPGGTFYPRGAIAYAALASVRTTTICGFDLATQMHRIHEAMGVCP